VRAIARPDSCKGNAAERSLDVGFPRRRRDQRGGVFDGGEQHEALGGEPVHRLPVVGQPVRDDLRVCRDEADRGPGRLQQERAAEVNAALLEFLEEVR